MTRKFINLITFIFTFVLTGNLHAQLKPMPPIQPGRIYIPVGNPNLKKILIAIDPTQGERSLAAAFHSNMVNDMAFTDFFELMPETRLPKGGGINLGTFDMNAYRALGIAFLIKSSISYNGSNVEAEVRLYDVPKGVQILARRYPFMSRSAQAARELANFSGNDIIQVLTGEPGVFRTRILMSCGNKRKEIFIMDFDGANPKQLTNDGNFALSPSWAPDGRRIAFTSYKPARKGEFPNPNIYMYDIISNQRSVVTAAKGINSGSTFHPFKNIMAYTFSNNGRPEIYLLDLERKTRIPVTQTHFFSVEPDFSPDGNRLAYSSKKTGKPHIYVSNIDGSNAVQLTKAGVYNSSPRWSPKGNRIAFSGQENRKNNFNIFTIDPNGSNLQRLTDGAHSSENPVFSPDGRYLAFSGNQSGQYRIYIMALHSGRISNPISPPDLGHCKQPAWSPRL